MKLSEFVKEKRNATNRTQPELAKKTEVGLSFVRDLEQDKETGAFKQSKPSTSRGSISLTL